MSKNKASEIDFEAALKELTLLVEQMEVGNLSLEHSLQKFEQGVNLIRHCQTLLKNAEQRIQIYNKQREQLDPYKEAD
jgi:exodeoxyribonuclease VII small subunit